MKLWRRLALLAVAASPFAVAFAVDFPICPTAGIWDLPCPSCGLTRASVAALRGDLMGAHRQHPLVWIAAPVFFGALLSLTVSFLRGSKDEPWLPEAWSRTLTRAALPLGVGLMLLLTVVWVARFYGYFGGPAEVMSFTEWVGRTYSAVQSK